jgi:hypothetical protein
LCNKHGLEDPDNQVQIEEYMTSSDYQWESAENAVIDFKKQAA